MKSEQLEWHGHNDYYYCTANSTAAWMYGASSVSTTLLGIGERTGNCPMESMLVEYHQLKEPKNKINFAMLNEIVAFFDEEFGFKVHTKMPFLGAESNSTRAGIHADGIMKNADIYNSFNSKDIFNRNIKIVVNQYSGVAGISGWINLYYDLPKEMRISKRDSRVSLIKNLIDAEYDAGRTTAISDKEMVKFTEQIFGKALNDICNDISEDKKGVL